MIPDLSLEDIGKLAAGGGSFSIGLFFVRWLFTFIGDRVDKKEAGLDKARAAVDEATALLIKNLQEQITGLFASHTSMRAELNECEHRHRDALARVAQLEARLQGYGEANERAALIVAQDRAGDAKLKDILGE